MKDMVKKNKGEEKNVVERVKKRRPEQREILSLPK